MDSAERSCAVSCFKKTWGSTTTFSRKDYFHIIGLQCLLFKKCFQWLLSASTYFVSLTSTDSSVDARIFHCGSKRGAPSIPYDANFIPSSSDVKSILRRGIVLLCAWSQKSLSKVTNVPSSFNLQLRCCKKDDITTKEIVNKSCQCQLKWYLHVIRGLLITCCQSINQQLYLSV